MNNMVKTLLIMTNLTFGSVTANAATVDEAADAKDKCKIEYQIPVLSWGAVDYNRRKACLQNEGFDLQVQKTPEGVVACGISEAGSKALLHGDCTPRA